MIAFSEIFNENYQYYLKNIDYKVITIGHIDKNIVISIKDTISHKILSSNEFILEVNRNVNFHPDQLYNLSITFEAVLSIKNIDKINNINWDDEFRKNPVFAKIIQGLLSRISMQIAQITSSYGQNPLVTPPSLIE